MIEQRADSVTIRGAPMLSATYRAVLHAIARRRHDGLPSSDLPELARALRRAHDEAVAHERHELATAAADQPRLNGQEPRDDWCSTGEASVLLGLSRRSVQRMARRDPGGLDSIRVGRTYLVRLAPVLALAAERRRNNKRPNGLSGQL